MKTELKQVIRKYRTRPDEMLSALSTITPGELTRGVVDPITARELRLHSRERKPLCERFDRYDKANPDVGEWLLSAAQELKEEPHRERYGAETTRFERGVRKTELSK